MNFIPMIIRPSTPQAASQVWAFTADVEFLGSFMHSALKLPDIHSKIASTINSELIRATNELLQVTSKIEFKYVSGKGHVQF